MKGGEVGIVKSSGRGEGIPSKIQSDLWGMRERVGETESRRKREAYLVGRGLRRLGASAGGGGAWVAPLGLAVSGRVGRAVLGWGPFRSSSLIYINTIISHLQHNKRRHR